ncbi:MAG: hypothetical protein LBU44_05955 [Mediterranea sp.]|jgi:hypothetical protein|nr:hypothetical protein [Mediterranea sp.]
MRISKVKVEENMVLAHHNQSEGILSTIKCEDNELKHQVINAGPVHLLFDGAFASVKMVSALRKAQPR